MDINNEINRRRGLYSIAIYWKIKGQPMINKFNELIDEDFDKKYRQVDYKVTTEIKLKNLTDRLKEVFKDDEIKNLIVSTKLIADERLKSMKIYKRRGIHFFNTQNGAIENEKDRLIINKKSSYYHELLHLLSCDDGKGDIFHVGFHTCARNVDLKDINDRGRAINEGYTQYLREKCFITLHKTSYGEQIKYAERIKNLIGENKMIKLYLNHDLNGLIKELEDLFSTKKAFDLGLEKRDAEELILWLDYIMYNNGSHSGIDEARERVEEILSLAEKINMNEKVLIKK